jgi:glutaminase
MKYRKVLTLLIFTLIAFPVSFAQKKVTPALQVVTDPSLTPENIQKVLDEAYAKFKDVKEGNNADYIKELAKVDPNIYGITIVTTDGKVYTKGDLTSAVSIQSISKVFTLARVIEEQGPKVIMDKIGVDATGMRFNSIVAVELQKGKEINPLVNPGAIAASSLVSGADSAAKWKNILQTHCDFAGRTLALDMPVYISEAGDNLRNQAIAHLLKAYGRMYFDPVESTDLYTKQCAISVTVKDLAVMAGTLANGGLNPITKKVVVSPETVKYTLPVMATSGLYDDAGQWLYATGLPAKSGVGGGIIAVVPGKFGIAVISPPLSPAGNSIKAIYTIRFIVDALGINPYLITPKK